MSVRLLSIPAVAEMINMSVPATYRLAREGILPVVRIGRQIRVDEGQLQEWIQNGGHALPGGWKQESMAN